MKIKAYLPQLIVISIIAIVMTGSVSAQTPTSAGFTYQGYLELSGVPVTNTCDFQFSLWDALETGNQIGTTQEAAIPVSRGLFNAVLDFGETAFNGDARWLEILVRCPSGEGLYTTLSPRSHISAVPYAVYALRTSWSGLSNIPAGFADGVDNTGSSYGAGNQLSLVSDTFNVVEGNGSDLDADLLDGNHASYFQARVGGTCEAGNSIRAIDADGNVTCQAVPGTIQIWNMSTWTADLTLSSTSWTEISGTFQNITIQHTGQMLIMEYLVGLQGSGDVVNSLVAIRIAIDGNPVDGSISVSGGTSYVQLHGQAAINTITPGVHQIKLSARLLSAGSGTTWTNTVTSGTTTGRSFVITLYP